MADRRFFEEDEDDILVHTNPGHEEPEQIAEPDASGRFSKINLWLALGATSVLLIAALLLIILGPGYFFGNKVILHDAFSEEERAEGVTIAPKPPSEVAPSELELKSGETYEAAAEPPVASEADEYYEPASSENITASASEQTVTTPAQETPVSANGIYVQILASRTRDQAAQAGEAIKRSNGYAYRVMEVPANGTTWYRLMVGPFASEGEATQALPALKRTYPNAFIKHIQ